MSSTGMAQQKRQDEILGMAIYYYAYSTWEGAMLYVEDIFVLPNVRGKVIDQVGVLSWWFIERFVARIDF